jgi:hypothetical protein
MLYSCSCMSHCERVLTGDVSLPEFTIKPIIRSRWLVLVSLTRPWGRTPPGDSLGKKALTEKGDGSSGGNKLPSLLRTLPWKESRCPSYQSHSRPLAYTWSSGRPPRRPAVWQTAQCSPRLTTWNSHGKNNRYTGLNFSPATSDIYMLISSIKYKLIKKK